MALEELREKLEGKKRIDEAIRVYEASRTGRGLAGTPQERHRALAVAFKLRHLVSIAEIGFTEMGRTFGMSYPGGRRHAEDLELDWRVWDVAAASITAVHEGVHLTEAAGTPYVDEELVCRRLQLLYYEELRFGVPYDGSKVARLRMGRREASLRKQSEWHSKDRLVDYIIKTDTYSSSLTADWVAKNAIHWGGLKNRCASTKGHYLRVLAEGHSPTTRGDLATEILETLNAGEWPEVVRIAHWLPIQTMIRTLSMQPALYKRLRAASGAWGPFSALVPH